MAVRIRLARYGRKKRPFYRIVAQDSQRPRDGKFLEILGTFDPLKDEDNLEIKEERIKYWVENGALTSPRITDIMREKVPGFITGRQEAQREKLKARRAARKARAAKAA